MTGMSRRLLCNQTPNIISRTGIPDIAWHTKAWHSIVWHTMACQHHISSWYPPSSDSHISLCLNPSTLHTFIINPPPHPPHRHLSPPPLHPPHHHNPPPLLWVVTLMSGQLVTFRALPLWRQRVTKPFILPSLQMSKDHCPTLAISHPVNEENTSKILIQNVKHTKSF